MQGREQDWVFVDWADFSNTGAVSTEQILFVRALEAMSIFASLMEDEDASARYGTVAEEVKVKTLSVFWDDSRGGLLHHRVDGETQPVLTKHASMFAMTYGYLSPEQKASVVQKVMLNPEVPRIRTPYMRFHELAVLCESGEHEVVYNELQSYWGGMMDLGATSFWEEYDPSLAADEHYGMYGMSFGKSLCHAWGAGPVYLLGKYFLGVRPLTPGYATYTVEPHLGGLEWMEGTVPAGPGDIEVYMDQEKIRVRGTHGQGVLKYVRGGQALEAAIPGDGAWVEVGLV